MPKIAVIILNYNGQQYLKELFDSLNKTAYPVQDWQIFFIDNASADQSLAWMKKYQPACRFIANQKNLGFAEGNNVGLKAALKENFEYLVLLNQDTAVEPDWLTELVKKAESDDKIGAAQSLILLYNQPELINTAGNMLHYLGFGWSGQFKFQISKFKVGDQIGYASGAAVLYRANVLRQVGLLDEKFFMYHEDLDLSWRIQLAGYKIVLATQSIIYHKYQFFRHRTKFYFTERNRLICFFANYSLKTIILFLPALIFAETAMLAYSLLSNFFIDKIKGYGWLFKNFSYIIKKRRKLQALRRVEDKEIIKFMRGDLEFAGLKNVFVQLAGKVLQAYFEVVKMWV